MRSLHRPSLLTMTIEVLCTVILATTAESLITELHRRLLLRPRETRSLLSLHLARDAIAWNCRGYWRKWLV